MKKSEQLELRKSYIQKITAIQQELHSNVHDKMFYVSIWEDFFNRSWSAFNIHPNMEKASLKTLRRFYEHLKYNIETNRGYHLADYLGIND